MPRYASLSSSSPEAALAIGLAAPTSDAAVSVVDTFALAEAEAEVGSGFFSAELVLEVVVGSGFFSDVLVGGGGGVLVLEVVGFSFVLVVLGGGGGGGGVGVGVGVGFSFVVVVDGFGGGSGLSSPPEPKDQEAKNLPSPFGATVLKSPLVRSMAPSGQPMHWGG
jgi:hypothetical protein